jgi:HK97 family phage prohead protease
MAQREVRYLAQAGDPDIELRVETRDDGRPVIVGIAPPWNKWSVDLGGFKERFMPGAFRKWLDRSPNDPRGLADVVAKYNHEDSKVLGRTTNGTLDIQETEKGLVFRATPPVGTPTTAEVVPLISQKYIFGSSFAFSLVDARGEQWDEDPAGNVTRTITEAAIFDVSPVTHAAYPNSSVGLRSLSAWKAARGLLQHRAEGRGLLISLDYDRTFTAAPGLWRSFVGMATAAGNKVVCISRREDDDANREELRLAFSDLEVSDLILCGAGTQKRDAAARAGLDVDVWVDDYPEGIVAAPSPVDAARSFKVSTLAGARAAAAAAVARMRIHAG